MSGTAPSEVAYSGRMAALLVQDPSANVLTAADRCDRCGAQAYLAAGHMEWPQEILFCGHHARIHVPALETVEGVWIHDETDRLYEDTAKMKQATTEV